MPWTAAWRASLSFTIFQSLLKLMLSWWCHPTISSSVVPFSSCLQSFPASGSFLMSWLFQSGGQLLELQLQHQSFQWIFRVDFLYDWLVWCPWFKSLTQDSKLQPCPRKKQWLTSHKFIQTKSKIHRLFTFQIKMEETADRQGEGWGIHCWWGLKLWSLFWNASIFWHRHFSLEFIQINTDLSTHTQIVIMEFFVNIKNLNAYKWDQWITVHPGHWNAMWLSG